MTHPASMAKDSSQRKTSGQIKRGGKRRRYVALTVTVGALITGLGCIVSLSATAAGIQKELKAATSLVPSLKENVSGHHIDQAKSEVEQIRAHTSSAVRAVQDPLWTLAASLPVIGQNFSAVSEVARSADDVASLALTPLVTVYASLDWDSLLPSSSGAGLEPIEAASPTVSSAAHAVKLSAERLSNIDTSKLHPLVAQPVDQAREQITGMEDTLEAAADAARLAPDMLGANTTRHYLLVIQNNAEVRATGGIPGALAILTLDNGKLTLGDQSTASALGAMTPIVQVDSEQQQIYTQRLGTYMQDVNLTPDFPTSAGTAQIMWERETGQRVDGVISIDPVALGYVLGAIGPVALTDANMLALASEGLPTELTGANVVQTLLSDVYAVIEQPALQDAYFAGVAREVFKAFADGRGSAKGAIDGLTRGTAEGRVLVWSGLPEEQSIIARYSMSGAITGPSVSPASIGVYFNDGTGAKMDFYMQRTVQLISTCAADDYSQYTVRITSTNTAPADAATSLPAYVTGSGAFGVPAGTVQTNVTAYGPIQSNLLGARYDDSEMPLSSHRHDGRPVGTTTVTVAPGETSTVEITFNKVVQTTRPELRVTPTVQDFRNVKHEADTPSCPPRK